MSDTGLNGAVYGADGNIIGGTFERLGDGDGWEPFANLPAEADANPEQAVTAKRTLENGAAESFQKRTKLSSEDHWNDMLERLRAFRDRFGHSNVPKRYFEDPQLGTWVDTQRINYRKQNMHGTTFAGGDLQKRLSADRIARLEALGFVWSPRKSRAQEERILERQRLYEENWENYYERLAHYKANHGNTLVPRKYLDDPDLSAWVEMMRALWNRDYRSQADPNLHVPDVINAPVETRVDPTSTSFPLDSKPSADVTESSEETVLGQSSFTDDAAAAAVLHGLIGAPVPETLEVPLPTKGLTRERKEKLDQLGFVWCVRMKQFDDQWDEMFRQLIQYKEKHGDCLVPSRYEENIRLGKWIETQRYEYTKRKRAEQGSKTQAAKSTASSRLTAERQRRLESIGFEWKVKNKMKRFYNKQWDKMFEKLLAYKEEFGNTRVPKHFSQDPKLASWAQAQRSQYRKLTKNSETHDIDSREEKESHRLTEDRRNRLAAIGFEWFVVEEKPAVSSGESTAVSQPARTAYDDQWDAMYERLRDFKEKNGHCLVPKRCEDGKLGTWVDTQRVQFKRMEKQGQQDAPTGKGSHGRLTSDRIKRLEDIGFVWSVRDDWNKHYEELKQFRKEHGHCNVPARHANRRLGVWVSSQRQLYKLFTGVSKSKRRTNPLTKERIDKLNALDFTWAIRSTSDAPRDGWNRRIAEFNEFRQTYGHCLIPFRFDSNPELGLFADSLRRNAKIFISATLSGQTLPDSFPVTADRLRQLAELGFLTLPEAYSLEHDGGAVRQSLRNEQVEAVTGIDMDASSR